MFHEHLRRLGANFAQFQGAESPSDFGDPPTEYRAACEAVGLMDRSTLGRIRLGGQDRFDFLHRMSTNDMHNLKSGDGLQTVLTTPEAKIVELLTVYVEPETLLCITAPQNRAKIMNWFRRNIFFRDKVKPLDVSESTVQVTLFGPRAHDVLGSVYPGFPALADYHSRLIEVSGAQALAAHVPLGGSGGYDLIAPADAGDALWQTLTAAGEPFGLRPMGTTAFNWLRLSEGQPLYGYELSEEHNPLEARLNHAVSFSKGCYTGQEVIARLDTYQKLKQVLSIVQLSDLPRAPLPLPLRRGDQDAGTLTSAARLPGAEHVTGLGYVRSKSYQPGAPVTVHSDDGSIDGTLVALTAA